MTIIDQVENISERFRITFNKTKYNNYLFYRFQELYVKTRDY